MDLLAEVLNDDARSKGCGVGLTLAAMDPELREQVLAALAPDSGAKHAAIARALTRRGVKRPDGGSLSQLQIGTHRKGDCSCG